MLGGSRLSVGPWRSVAGPSGRRRGPYASRGQDGSEDVICEALEGPAPSTCAAVCAKRQILAGLRRRALQLHLGVPVFRGGRPPKNSRGRRATNTRLSDTSTRLSPLSTVDTDRPNCSFFQLGADSQTLEGSQREAEDIGPVLRVPFQR